MPTLTIRNLPDDLIERLRRTATRQGHSMEQEVRLLLQARYMEKGKLLDRVRSHWDDFPAPTARETARWRQMGQR